MAHLVQSLPILQSSEAYVWQVDLAGASGESCAFDLLALDEQGRANRLRLGAERRRFIHARAALRLILGGFLGQAPGGLSFAHGPYGKPHLSVSGAPHFNLSHSGDLALIAVCRDHPIGVDVEQVAHGVDDLDDIARNFFSTNERGAYFDLSPVERLDACHRVWTRKEAVAKALGLGMFLPGPSFNVSVSAERPRLLHLNGGAEDWRLIDLAPGPGFFAAVAARAPGLSVVMHHFTGSMNDG